MSKSRILPVLLSVLLGSSAAYCQSTLGEVLDKGGQKLTRTELVALLPGASSIGPNADGHDLSISYRTDGTMNGRMTFSSGQNTGRTVDLSGTWNVAEDGKVCGQIRSASGQQSTVCAYMFRLEDQVYAIPSDVDRAARATLRNLRK